MKPTETIAEDTLGQGRSIRLYKHDGHFFINLSDYDQASTFKSGSAETMVETTVNPFRPARQPKLLFAGLGFGFGLAKATEELRQEKAVFHVVDSSPVKKWHQKFFPKLHGDFFLEDSRIEWDQRGIKSALTENKEKFAAIYFDTVNCAWALGRDAKMVEDTTGLGMLKSALKKGGLLVVLMDRPAPGVSKRIERAGFDVVVEKVPVSKKGKQTRFHHLFICRKGIYETNR